MEEKEEVVLREQPESEMGPEHETTFGEEGLEEETPQEENKEGE